MDLSIHSALTKVLTLDAPADEDRSTPLSVDQPLGPPPAVLRRRAELAGIRYDAEVRAHQSARAAHRAALGSAYGLRSLTVGPTADAVVPDPGP